MDKKSVDKPPNAFTTKPNIDSWVKQQINNNIRKKGGNGNREKHGGKFHLFTGPNSFLGSNKYR
jgi:hypothetical protein